MFPKEQTDPLAAQVAEMALRGPLLAWLLRAIDVGPRGLSLPHQPERAMAKEVVDMYAAQMEHRDGLRRVVLYGEWEIDPAAVTFVPAARTP